MNAQEHFRVAEHLITAPDGAAKPREREIALAQVHATLALAAAINQCHAAAVLREGLLPYDPFPSTPRRSFTGLYDATALGGPIPEYEQVA
jgi:hypothetical protein